MEKFRQLYTDSSRYVVNKMQPMRFPWQHVSERHFRLSVVTGDRKGAGTDANVYVIIHDSEKRSSNILEPKHLFKDDHERGTTTHFDFDVTSGVEPPFERIEIWRDDFGAITLPFGLGKFAFGGKSKDMADWFLDRIEITIRDEYLAYLGQKGNRINKLLTKSLKETHISNESSESQSVWVFPVHRWINERIHYFIPLHDSILPQHDDRRLFREEELRHKKNTYVYVENVKGGPIQVEEVPDDEKFSENFYWTFVEKKAKLIAESGIKKLINRNWKSIDDMKEIYKFSLKPPLAVQHWKEDGWFALQRLQGADATIIRLCETVPENIEEPSCMAQLLEGNSLSEAVSQKKIFLCNLSILKGLQCKNDRKVGVPIALFYLNSRNELLPVLIQLRQEISPENPVFTPLDPPNTWLVAKMYYNNAEAQFHQACTHLGFTHLLMEGVCAAVHRNLSPSHPIFRLLAPHFLYLIAINKRGEEKLINAGGWVDSTMTQGTEGMFQLMAKHFFVWNFTRTNLIEDLKERGLLDEKVLPYYPYRDDGVKLYRIIRSYVEKIVSRYYDSSSTLKSDWEIQNFRRELSSPFPAGIGFTGVPGSDSEGFADTEEVIETITGIISTCSLGHAAANSQQYEQYAFNPNYPGTLSQDPPTRKDEYTDADIFALLPSKTIISDTVVITKLLSSAITNSLGYFEVQYLYDPEDVEAAEILRKELEDLSDEICRKNETREYKYIDLDPKLVPNSISI